MKKQNGFSLIEMLVVAAMIGVIAAIAIPSLFGAKRAANEASALQTLRTISSAENIYVKQMNGIGYMEQLSDAKLVDTTLADIVTQETTVKPITDLNPDNDDIKIDLTGGGIQPTPAPARTRLSKSGYTFHIILETRLDPDAPVGPIIGIVPGANYTISAVPQISSGKAQTGTRRFCITNNGIVRSSDKNVDRHLEDIDGCNASFGEILR